MTAVEYDAPLLVADVIGRLAQPLLLATDVDGTLSPIVVAPDAARLVPGALEALLALDADPSVHVAVVSGRPLVDLFGQFGLPDTLHVVGSHGAEFGASIPLDSAERSRLDEVRRILAAALVDAPGAHIEDKPVAAALHVRAVAAEVGGRVLQRARVALADMPGITVHEGHCVLEVAVRKVNKAAAVALLRDRLQPATVVFIGDDASDEGVFATLTDADVSVKVGPTPTLARWRVASPYAVADLLTHLAAAP